jgi:hypothetical protein
MIIDFAKDWEIISPQKTTIPTELAATELSVYLCRITGKDIPIQEVGTQGKYQIRLICHDADKDGFSWEAAEDHIRISGDNERGLLFGVYSFLEALGVRWISPGAEGERVPKGTEFHLPVPQRIEQANIPERCLILGHYAFLKDAEEWIVWAARNRMNTIFFHVIEDPLPLGAAPESQFFRKKSKLLLLAKQRGMIVEYGGHGLVHLLPRKLFKKMPDAFRMQDGKRQADYNFCPTHPEGRQIIMANAEKYFAARQGMDIYHLWADDIVGGGWCSCETCQPYSASEQALLATNIMAEALERVSPESQISFLAYHDTEDVPLKVKPHNNVCMVWAPRMRCYGHDTADETCSVNSPRYHTICQEQVDYFNTNKAKPSRVFEYYLDAVLFKSVLPPLIETMKMDLQFYHAIGIEAVQNLMTGDYPWISPQLNAWLFARLTWNTEQETSELLADFCRAYFGTDDAHLPRYYRKLEQAFALALSLDPREIVLTLDNKNIWKNPPVDMGDPVNAPVEVINQKLKERKKLPDLVVEAEALLKQSQETASPQAWEQESTVFELAKAWLLFDYARLQLYANIANNESPVEIKSALFQAELEYKKMIAWSHKHLTEKKFRNNFEILHQVHGGIRLKRIRADYSRNALQAFWLKWQTQLSTLLMVLRMRNTYH